LPATAVNVVDAATVVFVALLAKITAPAPTVTTTLEPQDKEADVAYCPPPPPPVLQPPPPPTAMTSVMEVIAKPEVPELVTGLVQVDEPVNETVFCLYVLNDAPIEEVVMNPLELMVRQRT
jgi:hypothetical protein